MFLWPFGPRERSDDPPDVEMLDLETLRTRIGAEDPPAPTTRRRPAVIVRFDGRSSSPERSWRDAIRR